MLSSFTNFLFTDPKYYLATSILSYLSFMLVLSLDLNLKQASTHVQCLLCLQYFFHLQNKKVMHSSRTLLGACLIAKLSGGQCTIPNKWCQKLTSYLRCYHTANFKYCKQLFTMFFFLAKGVPKPFCGIDALTCWVEQIIFKSKTDVKWRVYLYSSNIIKSFFLQKGWSACSMSWLICWDLWLYNIFLIQFACNNGIIITVTFTIIVIIHYHHQQQQQ